MNIQAFTWCFEREDESRFLEMIRDEVVITRLVDMSAVVLSSCEVPFSRVTPKVWRKVR